MLLANLGSFRANAQKPQPDLAGIAALKAQAENGDVEAAWFLGTTLFYGAPGVTKDQTEGVRWYRKAANGGSREAQVSLGICYRLGDGVPRDDTQAVVWFRKSAEQGDPDGQTFLADCYIEGAGVAKNEAEAVKWWRAAAGQGHPVAQFKLGQCLLRGIGTPKEVSKALKLLRQSAEQGEAKAQITLGNCYHPGTMRGRQNFGDRPPNKATPLHNPSSRSAITKGSGCGRMRCRLTCGCIWPWSRQTGGAQI